MSKRYPGSLLLPACRRSFMIDWLTRSTLHLRSAFLQANLDLSKSKFPYR